jgi:hypothetical protein
MNKYTAITFFSFGYPVVLPMADVYTRVFRPYCRSNWSVPQILIQYITSGWPIHLIKFLEIFMHFLVAAERSEAAHYSWHAVVSLDPVFRASYVLSRSRSCVCLSVCKDVCRNPGGIIKRQERLLNEGSGQNMKIIQAFKYTDARDQKYSETFR